MTRQEAWRLKCLHLVAGAAQNLEDGWLAFFRTPDSMTLKTILQAEECLCDNLSVLRAAKGDKVVRDWEAVERSQKAKAKP